MHTQTCKHTRVQRDRDPRDTRVHQFPRDIPTPHQAAEAVCAQAKRQVACLAGFDLLPAPAGQAGVGWGWQAESRSPG